MRNFTDVPSSVVQAAREPLRAKLRLFWSVATAATVCLATSVYASSTNRSVDGTGNNAANPAWGAAGTPLARQAAAAYADGISTPNGGSRPSAREISNGIAAAPTNLTDPRNLSSFVFQWGQFLDHDIDLTVAAQPSEAFNIDIPSGDPIFDPLSTGTQTMPMSRSRYDPASGTSAANPRQQINEITAYIDASNVYGSDATRVAALRTGGGLGAKLLTSNDTDGDGQNLLPRNGSLVVPTDPVEFFVAGDVRVNEQIALTAMHTLFMREHNRLVDELTVENPLWTDEMLYQRARKIVGAQMQIITYQEFLPALMGPQAPAASQSSYDPNVDASILNEFSAAIYRVGHTMLPEKYLRLNDDETPADTPLALRDAFFNPRLISTTSDLDQLLKGLASQRQQAVDSQLVDAVRNFLFGGPVPAGFDLAALNIQRGRDHGLVDYNAMRVAFGLPAYTQFSQITSDVVVQGQLAALYASIDDIDAWVGMLAEETLAGTSLGPLANQVMREQFERLRDGDRYWYENDMSFSASDVASLQATTLADIIRRNTGLMYIPDNVFFRVPEPSSALLFAVAALWGTLGSARNLGRRSSRARRD